MHSNAYLQLCASSHSLFLPVCSRWAEGAAAAPLHHQATHTASIRAASTRPSSCIQGNLRASSREPAQTSGEQQREASVSRTQTPSWKERPAGDWPLHAMWEPHTLTDIDSSQEQKPGWLYNPQSQRLRVRRLGDYGSCEYLPGKMDHGQWWAFLKNLIWRICLPLTDHTTAWWMTWRETNRLSAVDMHHFSKKGFIVCSWLTLRRKTYCTFRTNEL